LQAKSKLINAKLAGKSIPTLEFQAICLGC
jgi:hypothetical protein